MENKNYAAVDKVTKKVINNIIWDGSSYLDTIWKDVYDLIPWDENTTVNPVLPGFTYDENLNQFIRN